MKLQNIMDHNPANMNRTKPRRVYKLKGYPGQNKMYLQGKELEKSIENGLDEWLHTKAWPLYFWEYQIGKARSQSTRRTP